MANIQTHIAGKLVRQATRWTQEYAVRLGGRLAGPRPGVPQSHKQYKSGPWRVSADLSTPGTMGQFRFIMHLYHYGTAMLKWQQEFSPQGHDRGGIIMESWTGYGSVSDQSGVNSALLAIGSELRYRRDDKGGGPRVNPTFRVPTSSASIRAITPPVY